MAEITRRAFLKLTGYGGAAAVGTGMGVKVAEKLIPYVIPAEEPLHPGVWTYYATTCRECPAGCGMHVKHTDGRVTKAEGNPSHPVNRGALCARGQSALQGQYDPDRMTSVGTTVQGAECTWSGAIGAIAAHLAAKPGRVAMISDLQTGSMAELMRRFAAAFASDRMLFYEPFNYEPLCEAHGRLFGRPVVPNYHLDQCDFILSFGADFLETWVSPVQFAHDFSRNFGYRDGRLGRFAYVGPRLSMTAANAVEFIQISPGMERWIAMAILEDILNTAPANVLTDAQRVRAVARSLGSDQALAKSGLDAARIHELAERFIRGKSVALAGPTAAISVEAEQTAMAAGLLNYVAGRMGQSVDFSRPHALSQTATARQMQDLLQSLTKDDVLIVHNANPVFTMPGSLEMIRKAGMLVFLGTLPNETSEMGNDVAWRLPIDAPLETWGEYEPLAGIHGLLQPTMTRLYDTRNSGDILLAIAEVAGKPLSRGPDAKPIESFEQWLHLRWQELHASLGNPSPSKGEGRMRVPSEAFDDFWRDALRNGGRWEDLQPVTVRLSDAAAKARPEEIATAPSTAESTDCRLWLWPSVFLFDGRTANRGWMQEAPDPTSTGVWGTWIDLNPLQAQRLGLADGDEIELSAAGRSIKAPVRITQDVPDGVAAVALGQGHEVNTHKCGQNAFLLAGAAGAGTFGQVRIHPTGRRAAIIDISATQEQHDRELLQWTDLSKLSSARPQELPPLSLPLPEAYNPAKDLYPPHYYKEHRWAMVIDLQRCIGCGACVTACYAENNIAVVGAEQSRDSRHMGWMRIVPFRRPEDPGRLAFLPMLCQHCDAAPCEPVCPVFASVHNDEGLNAQVYNRCIGTRYCSHNCPYKVRRFNWFDPQWAKPLDWQLNPQVSARSRGVMEKCTFCIQRIRHAEIETRVSGKALKDGDIVPACAQTCPTEAIIFGDLMDDSSRVSELTRHDPRRYHLLEELNTRPGIVYLKRILT